MSIFGHHRKSGGSFSFRTPRSALRISEGFSLIEIMLTVTLLAIIILGLVAMFNQTRRAFTSSLTQVDVLESGRSAADLVTRELEQASAAGSTNMWNFFVDSPVTMTGGRSQLVQPLLIAPDAQINNLQRVCFITRYNQQWNFIGYQLLQPTISDPVPAVAGIGTLYRYSVSGIALTNLSALINNFITFSNSTVPSSNFSRLIDGVVDFRVRVADTNGIFFASTNTSASTTIFVVGETNGPISDQQIASFKNATLPAYVEVELGVLEDRALTHYKSLALAGVGPPSASWNYLTNHAGQVHIFRQRITIRNANPAAF